MAKFLEGSGQLVEFARPRRNALFASLGLGLLASAAQLAQPLAVSYVISEVSSGGSLRWPVTFLISLFFADAVFSCLQSYLLGKTGEGIVFGLRQTLIGHLLRLPVPAHDRFRTGDLLSRVNTDTTLLRTALTSSLTNAVAGVLTFVGAIALMAFIDPLLLGVSLACVAVATVVVLSVSVKVREVSEEAQRSLGRLGSSLDRALGAIRTVKLSNAEDRETKAITGEAGAAYEAGVRAAKLQALVEPASAVAINGSFVLVLGIGGARLASGDISVADLVAFLLYLTYLVMPLIMVFMSINDFQQGLAAVSRINEVLAEEPEKDMLETPARGSTISNAPVVRFDSVSFGYSPERSVLEDVSFEVPELSRVALVGPSGTGKSTIFSLIERFYEADSGTVSFLGQDVKEASLSELRGSIGYVEQDSPVMAGTIRSNLLYANPEAPEAEVEEVLDLTNLRSFVEGLPEGLETEVGDDGALLSGGERQRISIARTLLSKPKLLLLDEATSNLDAKNELALRETVSGLSERCAVMVIAHRLSTVVDADGILVLDDGRISGSGSHESLLATNPLYRELAGSRLAGRASRTPG
ncbi:MAG: ABC transporter ATP-binding protein [Rubrobacteraceae bacterium]